MLVMGLKKRFKMEIITAFKHFMYILGVPNCKSQKTYTYKCNCRTVELSKPLKGVVYICPRCSTIFVRVTRPLKIVQQK